jgi:hypothetical protein
MDRKRREMHIRDKNSKIEKKYRQIEKERQKLD